MSLLSAFWLPEAGRIFKPNKIYLKLTECIQTDSFNPWDYNQAVYDAQIHPRMYDLYMKNFELHSSLNCEMFVNFSYLGKRESQYGSWGVLENISDIYAKNLKDIAPKYQAIIDANKKN